MQAPGLLWAVFLRLQKWVASPVRWLEVVNRVVALSESKPELFQHAPSACDAVVETLAAVVASSHDEEVCFFV